MKSFCTVCLTINRKKSPSIAKMSKGYILFLSPVDSYGDDQELTTSTDSDDDVIKQFEFSVSRSQSFRSTVSEKVTRAGLERRQKFNRLPSNREEFSSEASDVEGTTHDVISSQSRTIFSILC